MGWKSTIDVTRELADERLADLLEEIFGDEQGANYQIVPKNNEN